MRSMAVACGGTRPVGAKFVTGSYTTSPLACTPPRTDANAVPAAESKSPRAARPSAGTFSPCGRLRSAPASPFQEYPQDLWDAASNVWMSWSLTPAI